MTGMTPTLFYIDVVDSWRDAILSNVVGADGLQINAVTDISQAEADRRVRVLRRRLQDADNQASGIDIDFSLRWSDTADADTGTAVLGDFISGRNETGSLIASLETAIPSLAGRIGVDNSALKVSQETLTEEEDMTEHAVTDEDDGITTGQIAAAVIGTILAVMVIGAIAVFVFKRNQRDPHLLVQRQQRMQESRLPPRPMAHDIFAQPPATFSGVNPMNRDRQQNR